MTSRQIVDEVLFGIDDDAPSFGDDQAMEEFFMRLNPVVAALYSAWMSTGFIANGSLFAIYEMCPLGMIVRAPYGFHLLGKDDVAYAIERSFRIFPGCVLPASADERSLLVEQWGESPKSSADPTFDKTVGPMAYSFEISDAYDRTDEVLRRYHFEFVKP